MLVFLCQPIRSQEILPKIIYPILAPPYNEVINATVEGIEKELGRSWRKPYSGDEPTSSASSIVLTNKTRKDITRIDPSSLNTSVVGLAELTLDAELYGVSMFISPRRYVEEILAAAPDVTEVVFFYDERRYTPPDTTDLAEELKLKIETISAVTMGDALAAIANENEGGGPGKALVFTRGFIEINEATLLDFIVKQTWKSRAVTVANKPAYVRAGLVLGVLPDFRGYGTQLAQLYLKAEATNFQSPYVENLTYTIEAINVRTARRLELDVSPAKLARFKLSYPSN